MIPRSSACILLDMEAAKEAFDRVYFGTGQPLTLVYKLSIQADWQRLNRELVPLMHELEAAERYERRAREGRVFSTAKGRRDKYDLGVYK